MANLPDSRGSENGHVKKEACVSSEEVNDERETCHAHRRHVGTAVLDITIAILPLYFIAFAVCGYIRDGSLASSFRNQALFKMAALNPTLFPIVFALIVAKFIKAYATRRLEQGVTLGHIQLLLGSRSLVSSVLAPYKLRSITCFVPLLVLLWILNPIGGQTTLRVVSRASALQSRNVPFVYWDTTRTPWTTPLIQDASYSTAADSAFDSALFSPVSSKNGTQDLFGNVHIPMLEAMVTSREAHEDGWYYTAGSKWPKPWMNAFNTILDLPNSNAPQPIYSSLLGLPFKRNDSMSLAKAITYTGTTSSTTQLSPELESIKQKLFGSDVVNVRSGFTLETSYMYTDCAVSHAILDIPLLNTTAQFEAAATTGWPASVATVHNGVGLTIAYDPKHGLNSSAPRVLGFGSLLQDADHVEPGTNTFNTSITTAWCNITTTYVEAEVICASENNCTVYRMRQSTKAQLPASLTALDGITYPDTNLATKADHHSAEPEVTFESYTTSLAKTFFQGLIDATSNPRSNSTSSCLTPLESYFTNPVQPFPHTFGGVETPPIYSMVDDTIFSQRLSQLINTYMLTGMDVYGIVAGLNVSDQAANEGNTLAQTLVSEGQMSIEHKVLHCNTVYLIVSVAISTLLFALGIATACFDATRRGPDVLDDFVNSIRHNPYVNVDQGPSMEDGQDRARRLKKTVIRMGDVRPDEEVGYVAIGTPSETQPVAKLDPKREYL